MKIIGISGSIASGKNFVTNILAKKLSCKIFDADLIVHNLYDNNSYIIKEIAKYFPQSYQDNKINRNILRKIIAKNPKKIKIIENIIHPQVKKDYQIFLQEQKNIKADFIILNIPLLQEKGGYDFDILIALNIFPSIQKRRYIARFVKNNQKNDKDIAIRQFENIKKMQLCNKARRKDADFIVNTSFSIKKTTEQIAKIANLVNNYNI